jgi:hypothetical protein
VIQASLRDAQPTDFVGMQQCIRFGRSAGMLCGVRESSGLKQQQR